MRILFDENMPISLAKSLAGHECTSVIRLGWQGTRNGKLLAKAESEGFQVLLTLDADMLGEINFAFRRISVLILVPNGQGKKAVNAMAPKIEEALHNLASGSVITVRHAN